MRKKNKVFKNTLVTALICVMSVSSAFAHSGNTDARGGHKDNKNRSGLGPYHYHCGGYPAHLHTNGVCPYSSGGSSNSSCGSSAGKSVASKSDDNSRYVRISDAKMYINGNEIPVFTCNKLGGIYVIAEDLSNYGFDVVWDGAAYTLSVVKNTAKPVNPLDMSYYRAIGNGTNLFKVNDSNPVKVIFKNQWYDIGYSPASYSCGGYMLISIDELKAFSDTWNWDSNSKSMSYTIN